METLIDGFVVAVCIVLIGQYLYTQRHGELPPFPLSFSILYLTVLVAVAGAVIIW